VVKAHDLIWEPAGNWTSFRFQEPCSTTNTVTNGRSARSVHVESMCAERMFCPDVQHYQHGHGVHAESQGTPDSAT
jgi:hypothetical protein